jgi:acyl-CoA carboxylase subunit beta
MHRTTERAAEMAADQGVRSLDLLRSGIVDRIVAERPDAADEPADFCARVGQVLAYELITLLGMDAKNRYERRLERYRRLGLPATR